MNYWRFLLINISFEWSPNRNQQGVDFTGFSLHCQCFLWFRELKTKRFYFSSFLFKILFFLKMLILFFPLFQQIPSGMPEYIVQLTVTIFVSFHFLFFFFFTLRYRTNISVLQMISSVVDDQSRSLSLYIEHLMMTR